MANADSGDTSTIGPDTTVRGNLSGDEDLLLEGRVEGSIALTGHLEITSSGAAEAAIEAESVDVHGEVFGEIAANAHVTVFSGARVVGNIRAPQVVIQEGAVFQGAVEMDVELPESLLERARDRMR